MINILKKLFGIGNSINFSELVKQGALILDVRTKGEFTTGHIRGSVNIPLDRLDKNLPTQKDKNKPIITCCMSGMRSASAVNILKQNGFTNVYNGGGWRSLQNKI